MISQFWLDDEAIVYIGKATSLRARLGQFFRHELGERRPHAGGHWLKTLNGLDRTFVHFAETLTAEDALSREDAALAMFKAGVSQRHRDRLHNPIPFANREHPKGHRKQTYISNDVLR